MHKRSSSCGWPITIQYCTQIAFKSLHKIRFLRSIHICRPLNFFLCVLIITIRMLEVSSQLCRNCLTPARIWRTRSGPWSSEFTFCAVNGPLSWIGKFTRKPAIAQLCSDVWDAVRSCNRNQSKVSFWNETWNAQQSRSLSDQQLILPDMAEEIWLFKLEHVLLCGLCGYRSQSCWHETR